MNLYDEAVRRFEETYARAQTCGLREPTAMSLATADAHGQPAVRMVLLKSMDARGFVFFTNHESRKASHLQSNPRAALGFHWQPLEEQISVEGTVEKITDAEADAYWATRPRESQVGAWTSLQSRPLESRDQLEKRFRDFESKFGSGPIPRPAHWSGFRVIPDRIEFWKAGPHRLHDRIVYEKSGSAWTKTRLYP